MADTLGQQVADFLGSGTDDVFVAQAEEAADLIAAVAKAYTRGKGFNAETDEPADDIRAVIKVSAARLVMNPAQSIQETYEGFSVTHGVWRGFTIGERHVLNNYRRTWA